MVILIILLLRLFSVILQPGRLIFDRFPDKLPHHASRRRRPRREQACSIALADVAQIRARCAGLSINDLPNAPPAGVSCYPMREGAGRPKGSGTGPTVTIKSVSMSPEAWAKLDALRGETSRGVWISSRVWRDFNARVASS